MELLLIVALAGGIFYLYKRRGVGAPAASGWEKRVVTDLLDRKRKEDAEATLLSELQSLGRPAAAPVAEAPAAAAATSSRSPLV